MTHAWKKSRAKAVKHARLMKQKPELRAALYGSTPRDPQENSRPRETAHQKECDNG